MRQFFNSAVALFRGQRVAMDYNKHAHARYRVCRAADKLTFGTFMPHRWEIPLDEIVTLYDPYSGTNDLTTCWQHPTIEVSYHTLPASPAFMLPASGFTTL